ncbi:MAG: vitamin B12 dependent-methionine synthase activation domain-containing protein [Bacteroidota bacterium]
MKILTDIPFELDIDTLLQKNHIEKGSDWEVEFQGLVDAVEKSGKPKILFKECFIDKRGADTISIGDITFKSHALRRKLDTVERVFVYVVTCGREVDAIELPERDFLKEYWLDTIKQALLSLSREYLYEYLFQYYKIEKIAYMQPGSGDATVWPIEQQKELFSVLGDVEALIGVKLTDSFLMVPNKTVSGIIFPTENDFKSCQLCHRENCTGRSAPFDQDLWESMQLSKNV